MSRRPDRKPRPPGAPAAPRRRGRLPLVAAGAAIALAAAFLLFRPRAVDLRGASSRNLLLVTLDTTRADHLGCYGDADARTPNLDRLAREGVRFERAYAPAPLTLPSHATVLSGLYPAGHGVRNNGRALPPGVRTVAQALKARGFATAAFVSSFSVDSRFGLDRGFDVYDDDLGGRAPFKTENAERRGDDTYARFSRWLGANRDRRFFAWVHFFDPHLPYDPPSPWKERFPGAAYDGEIASMDAAIGAVLRRLEETGLADRTVIVVAGDHGEGLGDKAEAGHGIFLYEETLRVPLILHGRGVLRPRVVGPAVRLVDVAPTLLELAGAGEETRGLQGRSLLDLVRGRERDGRQALVETAYPRDNFGWSDLTGIVAGGWKLIRGPKPELYDLGRDPGERENMFVRAAAKAPRRCGRSACRRPTDRPERR